MKNLMVINDEVLEIENIRLTDNGCLALSGQRSFYLYQNREDAGREAKSYYKNMAKHDPEEFKTIVGTEALIDWCLGINHITDHHSTSSLEEWLNLWLDCPEEHFGSYNSKEIDVRINRNLMVTLGFGCTQCVGYRA